MWIYRNSRTGQVTERPTRSLRLDALENWQLIGSPAEVAVMPTLVRPPDNAPKHVWVAYAVAQGAKESDARALRKDALIEEWGGDDGQD